MRQVFLVLLAVLLVACGPSAEDINATTESIAATTIAETAEAMPTQTPIPTPTQTPIPTPTAGEPKSCAEEYPEFADALNDARGRWDAAMVIADSAFDGIFVEPKDPETFVPISEMLQSIRDDVQSLDTPQCAAEAKQALLEYMDEQINVFVYLASGNVSFGGIESAQLKVVEKWPGVIELMAEVYGNPELDWSEWRVP